MNKIRVFLKKNYKIVLIISIGLILTGVAAYAESTFKSSDVTYDNEKSKLTSTTMQGAIDELNTKATTKIDEAKKECPDGYVCSAGGTKVSSANSNIVKTYSYDYNNCNTGEEPTCKEINCTSYSSRKSCIAGTIVKYKVNSSTTKYFYVLHDDGDTMTLQQRENTVENVAWNAEGDNTKGPLTALSVLENATSSWTNVNNQTYTMGSTNFVKELVPGSYLSYTGCEDNFCNNRKSGYTIASRTARARMLSIEELLYVGCVNGYCGYRAFMYNSTTSNNYDGFGYWLMQAKYDSSSAIYYNGFCSGHLASRDVTKTTDGVRAVVVINK